MAKNAEFQALAADAVKAAAASKAETVEAANAAPLPSGQTVGEAVEQLAVKIGEKLEVVRRGVLRRPDRRSTCTSGPPTCRRRSVCWSSTRATTRPRPARAAMQIAAMRPQYLSRDDVPADLVENERRIAEATAKEEGKPEQAWPKIVEGRVNAYFKDVALLDQPSVTDNKTPVGKLLDAAGIKVKRFVRFEAAASEPQGGAAPARASAQADGGRRVTSPYKRVLLKLSGEVFGGGKVGVDPDVVDGLAEQIATVAKSGVQVAVVVGGGNFFRGAELQQRGMERDRADYMGMLGTVMNCLALQDFLEKLGVQTRVQTAITMGQVAEPYIPRRAERHLEKGRVVIFGAGSGMPYFSTDTVAAQRALEISAEVLLMGKQGVDGVYSADPHKHPDAIKFDELTYDEYLARDLKVADATAISMARDYKLPMIFFSLDTEGTIVAVVSGEKIGTTVHA